MNAPHGLLVGATRGTGRALARYWAEQGHSLMVVGRRRFDPPLSGVSECIVDLVSKSAADEIYQAYRNDSCRLDNLVFLQRFRGLSEDAWEGELAVSLSATRAVIERMVPLFPPQGGSIVVVSSIASTLVAEEQPLSYHVAKGGLEQLVRYYGARLGAHHIRVNSVAPATLVKEESRQFYAGQPELVKRLESVVPLGRLGEAQDVVSAIDFFCSPAASFITGQCLVVDGGMSSLSPQSIANRLSNQ